MTILVAALVFGVFVVSGGTIVTLAALAHTERIEDEDRCPEIKIWHGTSVQNKGTKYPHRCALRAGHDGPHRVPHPNPIDRTDRDYWWNEPES